jgi:hypothetical protein
MLFHWGGGRGLAVDACAHGLAYERIFTIELHEN